MAQGLILGAVLAGGRSRRFGSDKAEAMLGGKRLVEHAIDSLRPHVAAVVICGGRTVASYDTLADRPRPDLGPLGGLNAALRHAAARGYAGVLTLGCDMPVLPVEVAQALIGPDAAIVQGQHLVGYWPSFLADVLDAHLATSDDRSIRRWLGWVRPRSVVRAGPPMANVNTQADLAALLEHWPAP